MDNITKQISEEFKNIYFIRGARNARYPNSHSILIGDYLIDTGISRKLLKKVKQQFVLNTVLLSHWHEDHISGNSILKDVRFLCHERDQSVIEDIDKMYSYYGVENIAAGEELKTLNEYLGVKSIKVDGNISDNDIIHIGEDLKLKIIYTPGHTAGHCSFLELSSKIGFFGDIDLTKFPYYGNIDADLIAFEKSIEKLKNLDINVAVTGHREPLEGKKEIKNELEKYKTILEKRDERILTFLSERNPISLKDFKSKNLIYKTYTFENFEPIAELIMVEKHLEKFLAQKLIIPKDNGFILS